MKDSQTLIGRQKRRTRVACGKDHFQRLPAHILVDILCRLADADYPRCKQVSSVWRDSCQHAARLRVLAKLRALCSLLDQQRGKGAVKKLGEAAETAPLSHREISIANPSGLQTAGWRAFENTLAHPIFGVRNFRQNPG